MLRFSRRLLLLFVSIAAVVQAQPHQRVDIGGRKLDYIRGGAGGPTIVFETGLADSLDVWSPVFSAVSSFGTTIAYSRAGFGGSDYLAGFTVQSPARDLHAMLDALRLPKPYVLVGRSFGGIIVRLYTSLYPQDVGGLVIVDGTHEQQVKRWGLIDSSYPAAFKVFYDSALATRKPPEEAAEIRETVRIQNAGAVEGLNPLPDIPIAVLTSMKVLPDAQYVNGTARGHVAWREMHDEWFRQSTNGIHVETSRAGHDMQHDDPPLVIDAIRFVVDRVKVGK